MSIRITSILFSFLAHGTAFFYLNSVISLDKPAGVEAGQGVKVTLVRAEKSIPSVQPEDSITKSDTFVKNEQKPPEYRAMAADSVAVSSETESASTPNVTSTLKRTLVDPKPVKVMPSPAPIAAQQIPSKAVPLRVAAVAPVNKSDWIESRTLVPSSEQAGQILAIEQAYAQALSEAIEKNKHYPLRARKKGQQGEVKVRFTILKDGTIAQVQISSSSHSPLLDRAASKAVESLGQFRPIPDQLRRNRWDFQVPVRFAVN